MAAPVASAEALPSTQTLGVDLTSVDDSLAGSPIALVMGRTGLSDPNASWLGGRYMDAVDNTYLAPHGFSGALQAVQSPEDFFNMGPSMQTGATNMVTQIMDIYHAGEYNGTTIDADHPITVFGYSQSAGLMSSVMEQLHTAGVPTDDVHFVLIGNIANPAGGLFSALDFFHSNPWIPFLNATMGNPTPTDLYPTDVYTLQYDGFSDFPNYPANGLAFSNAISGINTAHDAYLGLSQSDIENAHLLSSAAGGLVNFYGIDGDPLSFPLLNGLLMIPFIGRPLYDLLLPDVKILTDLAYGHVDTIQDIENYTGGFFNGPADVENPINIFCLLCASSTTIPFGTLLNSLSQGTQLGFTNMFKDFASPSNWEVHPLWQTPGLEDWVAGSYAGGFIDNAHPNTILDLLGSVVVNNDGMDLSHWFWSLGGLLG